MIIRRVVTGHSGKKSVIVSDGPSPKTMASRVVPDSFSNFLWSTEASPSVPHIGGDPASQSRFLPAVGESRLVIVTFPPDSVMMSPDFDAAAAAKENIEFAPDFAQLFEVDNPGMHTSDTVDYGIVLEGETWLEVDDGEQVRLGAKDVVIQNGTRHAWRNKSDKPATVAFVLIGANRTR